MTALRVTWVLHGAPGKFLQGVKTRTDLPLSHRSQDPNACKKGIERLH